MASEPRRAPTRAPRLPLDFRLSATVLAVADLRRSADWYRSIVGLRDEHPIPDANAPALALGGGGGEVVRLVETPGAVAPPVSATGLYHHAILLPDRAALAGFVRRLAARRTPVVGASDHHVSEAIYLEDPDGHGVEVYADRPREAWRWNGDHVAMTTEPLDLDDLLRAGGDPDAPAPAGTRLGHVHLKVRDTDEAERFYRDVVGFDLVAAFPGAAFLSVGGYHHHLGVNAWHGRGGDGAPDGTARLLEIRATVADAASLDALAERLGNDATREGTATSFRDPSGIAWHLDVADGS